MTTVVHGDVSRWPSRGTPTPFITHTVDYPNIRGFCRRLSAVCPNLFAVCPWLSAVCQLLACSAPAYIRLDGGRGLILLHFIDFKRGDFLAGLVPADIRLDGRGRLLSLLSHTGHLLTYRQPFLFLFWSAPG
jgi:hypothetical protein